MLKECMPATATIEFNKKDQVLQRIFAPVAGEMEAVEQRLLAFGQSPVPLLQQLGRRLTQAGGKRLRPVLYLLCAGKEKERRIVDAVAIASAIELIHMATLVHDDVIDHAELRRGKPTTAKQWGNRNAILAGDYLFAQAFGLIANQGHAQLMQILSRVIAELCEGEILQNQTLFQLRQSEEDYLYRIGRKTADFLAGCAECGGITAGMEPADVQGLKEFGHSLGLAFQIKDDLLDLTVTAAQAGKPVGSDLKQGILNLPVLHALHTSPRKQELTEYITRQLGQEGDWEQVQDILEQAGSLAYTQQRIDDLLTQARNSLPAVLSIEVRMPLLCMADFVAARQY